MRPAGQTFASCFGALAGIGLLVAALVAGVGASLVDRGATVAVIVGCGVSWVSSCAGATLLAAAIGEGSQRVANAVLASTAVRFLVALALAAPLLLGGWFPVRPLAVSLGVSYLLLLTVDSALGVRMLSRSTRESKA